MHSKHLNPKAIIVSLLSLAFASCASLENQSVIAPTIHLAGAVLTTAKSVTLGERTPMEKFTTKDVIQYFVDVTWDDVTKEAGMHRVSWNWYKETKLVSTDTKPFQMKIAPFNIWTRRAAYVLGTGKFRVDVLIDGVVTASANFEID